MKAVSHTDKVCHFFELSIFQKLQFWIWRCQIIQHLDFENPYKIILSRFKMHLSLHLIDNRLQIFRWNFKENATYCWNQSWLASSFSAVLHWFNIFYRNFLPGGSHLLNVNLFWEKLKNGTEQKIVFYSAAWLQTAIKTCLFI